MDAIKMLTIVLLIILGIMLTLLFALGTIFFVSKMNNKKEEENNNNGNVDNKPIPKTKKYKEYRTGSVMDFMEFDTVVDNMILQNKGNRYIMVVECQGINYDLMSEVEKNSVEEGFIQFLNTLRYPIQIYTQTRTVKLDDSIQTYKTSLEQVKQELDKQELEYNQMVRSDNYTQERLDAAYFELTKQRNLYEYGKDIIYTTEKMSSNKNVLNQKYYVIIPYFVEELGDNNFDKEEQKSMAFSELYTRAQSVIATLAVCGVNGRVLTSDELVELLYVAYNRDEEEVFNLEKALKAGYDELYSTAQDVVEKQMKALDKKIEEKAMNLAKEKVQEVQTEKQKALQEKKNKERDLVGELAQLIIKENAQVIGKDVAEEAVEKIKAKDKKEKGGSKNVEEKPKRTRKTKTA